jgi:predicted nucleotidyltransferase component of viral defense system
VNNKEQLLLAKVLNAISDHFADRAILRGGMVLKVMGSARYTNDLDYTFVPYKSKKDIQSELTKCLISAFEGCTIRHTLNSQSLRMLITVADVTVQLEAKVALTVKSLAISTQLYSPQFDLPKRLIHVADHAVSMANKLAAWNERRLVRDLYDVWFFLQMNILPDKEVLEQRLKKPRYSKLIHKDLYFLGRGLDEFYQFVRDHLSQLSDKEIANQLSDYLLPGQLVGIVPLMRGTFVKLR